MSRTILFSRVFPKGHPKEGSNTNFVEQIWNGLSQLKLPVPKNSDFSSDFMWSIMPLSNYGCKYHTIRAGHRFNPGDKFSPRVWSGKPYRSKQIIIAPDIEVVKTWDFAIADTGDYLLNSKVIPIALLKIIALNDGFDNLDDFELWFPKLFSGQVICWNESVNY
jgi:hypothetical protein